MSLGSSNKVLNDFRHVVGINAGSEILNLLFAEEMAPQLIQIALIGATNTIVATNGFGGDIAFGADTIFKVLCSKGAVIAIIVITGINNGDTKAAFVLPTERVSLKPAIKCDKGKLIIWGKDV